MRRRLLLLRPRLLLSIAAAGVGLLFLLPVLWMLSSALRPESEIFAYLSPLSVHTILPKTWTVASFDAVLHAGLPRTIFNSMLVGLATALLGLFVSANAAFALAVLNMRFRRALFALVVVSFSVPFDILAIPLASNFRHWGLANSYAGLILPGLANGLAIFLLRQFFLGISVELKEAARIDGASWLRILWGIYLPLTRPALISAGVILFTFQWQAYLWPLLIATNPKIQLGPVYVAGLSNLYEVHFGQIFAACVLLCAIPTSLMLYLQRTFTQSVATSGIK
jgi:putative chitobiose transport system permease protein